VLWPACAMACVLSAAAPAATAATVTVDCSGQSGGYASIGAALAALEGLPPNPTGVWDYVLLRSDCTENVSFAGERRIWLASEPGGGTRTLTAFDANGVVYVDGATTTLENLVLTGGGVGLRAENGANVSMYGVRVEDNTGSGIHVGFHAALSMNSGGSSRNGGYGLFVGPSSTATIGSPTSGEDPIHVSENGQAGLRLDRGFLSGYGSILVEDNAGPGIVSYSGDVLLGTPGIEIEVRNNQGGAYLSEGSVGIFWSRVRFEANGRYGTYVAKESHVSLFGATVTGHTGMGVEVAMNGHALVDAGTQIIGNGTEGGADAGGLRVDGSSNATLSGESEVVENAGPGITADLGSSLDVRDASVERNTGQGVRALRMSIVHLDAEASIQPNGGASVRCDATSWVVGPIRRTRACTNVLRFSPPRPTRPPAPN